MSHAVVKYFPECILCIKFERHESVHVWGSMHQSLGSRACSGVCLHRGSLQLSTYSE